ncbi:MAG: PilZ domain-containing protein [Candidatus Omnitrophica bacterium]|nr:PilZ domain-containing protein [Candidatus Omnitrophota bacterium]
MEKKETAGIERRKFKRLRVNFTVVYQVDRPLVARMTLGWRKEVEALMLDLSEGGMAIVTNYNIPPETILSLKFTLINLTLSSEKRIRIMRMTAQVRYNIPTGKKEHRLGVCFLEIEEEDRLAIVDFVKIASVAGLTGYYA